VVQAEAEAEVPILGPREVERLGVDEGLRVAIRIGDGWRWVGVKSTLAFFRTRVRNVV
jgi:hypothetical protein